LTLISTEEVTEKRHLSQPPPILGDLLSQGKLIYGSRPYRVNVKTGKGHWQGRYVQNLSQMAPNSPFAY
jgi:hypothetical protein